MRPWIFALLSLGAMPIDADASIGIKVQLDRHAFYCGEELSVRLFCANRADTQLEGLELQISLGSLVERSHAIGLLKSKQSFSQQFRLPTIGLRPQSYPLTATLRSSQGVLGKVVETVWIAQRPNPNQMPVWLWPHQAFLNQLTPFDDRSKKTLDWWADHGFTDVAVGEALSDDMLRGLDYAIRRGLHVCILPNGGLRGASEFDKVEEDDLWFKIGENEFVLESKDGPKLLNPFHPRVAQWHRGQVEQLMGRLADYPQIRTAFFNTEIVDRLRVNQNQAGKRRMNEFLGFTPQEIGDPAFVQPGVLADDDRGYAFQKFVFQGGNGLAVANRRTADAVHRYRPDILTINDPFREHAWLGGFLGVDVIGSWTYTNPDPKLMLYVETLRAACRCTKHIPLSTVTMLNYPGELIPNKSWTMMGPGRLAVTTWINLSRAPRMLGYYFSSACDPFASLEDDLVTPKKDVSAKALPPSTHAMMQRLAEQVIQPYGELVRRLNVAPRRVAVLSSAASGLYGRSERLLGYYSNLQVHHFYTVLAMAHLPADVIFDDQVRRFGLNDYDVLVLPRCEVLTESVYRTIRDFQDRGGLVIADQYLGPEIPDAISFDFDFTYRKKVTAVAIAEGRGYVNWNDHLQPDTAKLESMQGVSALEDQRILESYAARLRQTLDPRIVRSVDCDQPTALLNLLEGAGGRYLVVVNDRRTYDDRVGEYRAVLGKIVPQTVTITLNDWEHDQLTAYDLMARRALDVKKVDGLFRFEVALTDLGGTLVALYSRPLENLQVTVPAKVQQAEQGRIAIQWSDSQGVAPAGLQPVRVTLRDARGRIHAASGHVCLQRGFALVDFVPALNDILGTWRVTVEDLTTGKQAETIFEVIRSSSLNQVGSRAALERETIQSRG